ncbi:MAG: Gfo/Idh/MocA family protein [Halobacteriaceae archaeon]
MSVRIAFIGAGNIAGRHFNTLETMDDANVVAICDIDEDAAEEAGERFDAETFTDWEALYEEADFEAVFVCLPPFAHEGQEQAAAERGIDLFVEKPLALEQSYAEEVRDLVAENDVIAQVGYNWRYSPGVEYVQEVLAGRDVGYVDGYWWGGVPGGEDHWWRHKERSGGQTVEQATHIFDTVRAVAGDVTEVMAAGSNRLEELVDFSDVTSATMTHENDAVSHVSTSCAAESGKHGLEVVAEDATLTFSQDHVSGRVDGEEVEESFDADPYANEVEAFIDAVQTRDTSDVRAPYSDAVESLDVTLAVNESIESGEPVSLD